MKLKELQEAAYEANIDIVKHRLVLLTWGNASAFDQDLGVMAIKPSGVKYDSMKPSDMVLLDVETGKVIEEGALNPSSDTPTHLVIYRSFPKVGGIVHTHSHYATCAAQANRDIICLGTTHADHFYGDIPVTRKLTQNEIAQEYEENTGKVIVETFTSRNIDPEYVPGVIVCSHGPFAWGKTAAKAVENSVVLEESARMLVHTSMLSHQLERVQQDLLDKHFLRKHGADAYYGQDAGKG